MKWFKYIIIYLILSFSYSFSQEVEVTFNETNKTYLFKCYHENGLGDYYEFTLIPPNLVSPSVHSKIEKTSSNNYFYYYTIKNEETAEQNLKLFILKVGENVELVNENNTFWHFLETRYPERQLGWMADQGLEPTWETDGFVISSFSLPGILPVYFCGPQPTISVPSDYLSEELDQKIREIEGFPQGCVKRWTIAPVDLIDPFSSQSFIDTIKVYNQKSYSLNWIKDETIKNKYAGYLETAQNLEQAGEGTAAKVQLNNLLADLEADSLQYLTNESYALLRFNTEYLISKIPDGSNVIVNKLAGSVDYTIASSGGQVTYNYTVSNSDTSSQSIANVHVQNNSGGTLTAPAGWQATAQTGFGLSGFAATLQPAEISVSATLGVFSIVTTGLPAPGNIYLQSARSTVDSSDIFDNSFIAGVIVPTSSPEPFVALNFVDLLISYNNLCLANGWYTQSWAHNVQKVALDNTRLMLTLNVPASSLIIMQQFLLTMDSYHNSGFLTDEGFYLLRANCDYLISKLQQM